MTKLDLDSLPPAAEVAMKSAIEKARLYLGATAPNPPVGAAALNANGEIICVEAHEKAGTDHAEVRILSTCSQKGILDQVDTLVVTLEPCNHHGHTPPCCDAILKTKIRRVVFGALDPNPRVTGGGAARLQASGIEVSQISGSLRQQCESLIQPFSHWITTGRPWVTIKTAHTSSGSMIPSPGQKTFTSLDSLCLAHERRKRADAILTGSGTVLSDSPLFTVRHVPDHSEKKRFLVVMDRRQRVPAQWATDAETRGFEILSHDKIEDVLQILGDRGCHEVLVEAGPTLTDTLFAHGIWNEHIRITQNEDSGNPDQVEYVYRNN